MLSVEDLRDAKPQAWRDAADDAIAAAKHCRAVASYARDDVAATLKMCWVSDAGRAARARFVQHAGDYEAAGDALHGLAKTYDTLADAVSDAQRTLHAALDHAAAHGLTVAGDGEVTGHASGHDQDAVHDQVTHAAGLIADALAAATRADSTAADEMRTITALTTITSPDLVAQALAHEADSPLGIALRLNQGPDGLHPLNISATQLDAVRQASQETGISQQLLMSIVWQEQQWYQNSDPGLGGPQALAGHLFDWALEQTVKPDKSLGITHMKIPTARQVIARDRAAFTVDGTYLDDLDDARLTKYIEQNPGEDIRLSAHYLRQMKSDQHGAVTDKQLFLLYAADDPQMRDANARYGDDTAVRGGAIRPRAEHWETLQPRLHDAGAWAALTNSQRQQALNEIAAQTPAGTSFDLSPLYTPPGVTTTGTGTGPAVPGIPSPAPGPAPTPPVG
ncbi:hypothetical protein [Streptantibioticus silvisoli]|uniref:WXG100 family type VII secretion target n=1 Tax=Streptantibioticus silvisoli TaxID=2705255 RepID=A0ABT6VZ79_9ACTN|nr:hypothetical protein [Streptantibioticus silvisoli]MDI5963460.1 hypothetical protein [Streptantibioticus silvisoli]